VKQVEEKIIINVFDGNNEKCESTGRTAKAALPVLG
jgi:hypothetical protein